MEKYFRRYPEVKKIRVNHFRKTDIFLTFGDRKTSDIMEKYLKGIGEYDEL